MYTPGPVTRDKIYLNSPKSWIGDRRLCFAMKLTNVYISGCLGLIYKHPEVIYSIVLGPFFFFYPSLPESQILVLQFQPLAFGLSLALYLASFPM